jgi:basic membrane protein A
LLSFFITSSPCWSQPKEPLKVGFLYTGSASDCGWNNAHEKGRQYLETAMKGSVVTTRAENIPENASCERVMEKMIAQGNKTIFVTSYGFLEPALRVAKRHPDVRFMHCGRTVPAGVKNVGSYFSSEYYECLYAAGIVAGKVTRSNKLAFVGGYPIPALLWCINAFTLGARSVNPKATVQIVWINSWEDPTAEAEAARSLIEQGCDVLASSLNTSMTVCRTAEKAKVFSVGVSYDLHDVAPNGWLTGQSWNWGPLYVKIMNSIKDNSWKPENLRYGIQDGYAGLSPFGKAVPAAVRSQALNAMTALKERKLQIFAPGLKDREGKVRLAVGEKLDQAWLDRMDFVVPGVSGSLPKHQ